MAGFKPLLNIYSLENPGIPKMYARKSPGFLKETTMVMFKIEPINLIQQQIIQVYLVSMVTVMQA